MCYFIRFNLEWSSCGGAEVTSEQIFDALKEIDADLFYGSEETLYDLLCEEMKWYEYNEDMVALSKMFPDTLFELYGEGEDSEDIWKLTVKNGKSYWVAAKIVFPDAPAGYFD